jgi:hypothetical protein
MSNLKKTKFGLKPDSSEIIIYFIVWLFILVEPIFRITRFNVEISKNFQYVWISYIPVFILFLINTIWLIPKFLYNKKILLYISIVLVLSVLFVYANEIIVSAYRHSQMISRSWPPMGNPQQMGNPNLTPPPDFFPRPHRPFGIHQLSFFSLFMRTILILGLNTAVKVTVQYFKDETKRRTIEQEYLKSELTFLQNQVSPHFFMNTLNNIHSLIDISTSDAQLSIVKLSKMMRYLLYESEQGNTTLQKEIDFLQSFIDLMKLRIDKSVEIKFSVPENIKNVTLPPLLMLPFIENSFKHGISYREKSFIHINIEQKNNEIILECRNSIPANSFNDKPVGVGLKNVRKRLDLLFNSKYTLNITDNNKEFVVNLILPVNEA